MGAALGVQQFTAEDGEARLTTDRGLRANEWLHACAEIWFNPLWLHAAVTLPLDRLCWDDPANGAKILRA
jgi:hypothetical protein